MPLALWNGRDPILKERLFGLTGNEGNHGEDVKEYYFYLDSTPTHSYMKYLYKYPQREFPYAELVEENRRRGKQDPEFELLDTGIFDRDRYFDVFVEYAKADVEDILIRITVANRGPEPARLHLLPTLWFRNTWSWGYEEPRPMLKAEAGLGDPAIELLDPAYGQRWLYCEGSPRTAVHRERDELQPAVRDKNPSPYVKDGINDYMVHGKRDAVNPAQEGTKAAADYDLLLAPGESRSIRLRLTDKQPATPHQAFGPEFDRIFEQRKREADEFYAEVIPQDLSLGRQERHAPGIRGHALVEAVLPLRRRDSGWRAIPRFRLRLRRAKDGRNQAWTHLYNADVISMPDKWEYPWYAAWDLAFHCVPLAWSTPTSPRSSSSCCCASGTCTPTGSFPPTSGRSATSIRRCTPGRRGASTRSRRSARGKGDRAFLERVFHKLLLNFTWWVNRKDAEGMNVFQGGFLGPRQHRRVRPQRHAAHRRPPRTVRRHQLDGDVHAEPAGHRAGAGARGSRL